MTRFRKILFFLISLPLIIIFIWFFAIPESLIKTSIEGSISGHGKLNINPSIKGLRKGLFFTLYIESIELKIDRAPVLRITDISSRINPLYILKRQFVFSIKGKIGTGEIRGFFQLPEGGNIKIDKVEISAIPYLTSVGLEGSGLISAHLNLKNNTMEAVFKIPDANINGSVKGLPLPIHSFRKIQGAFSLKENTIKITSISLEGDKAYARIKGEIINGLMHLTLELMPSTDKLKPTESVLISKYQILPGYYVIPIEGPLFSF